MTRPTLLLALALPLAPGCSTPHAFRLDDVAALEVGRSTRTEVEEVVGAPAAVLAGVAFYVSHGSEVSPPSPFSFLTWPIYFGRTSQSFAFLARYDAQQRLVEGSLTLEGFRSYFLFLILTPHGPLTFDGEEYHEVLSEIAGRGIAVWVREGYERELVPGVPEPD